MTFVLYRLGNARPAMKGSLPSAFKEVGMAMASFFPVRFKTGWSGHGLGPSLLYKGQSFAMALLSWRRGT